MKENDSVFTQEGHKSNIEVIVIQGNSDPAYGKYQAEIEKIKLQGVFLNYDTPKCENWRSFSEMDEKDKYTERLVDCTGIVIFGKRRDSGEIISCIAHTDEISALSEMTDPENIAEKRLMADKYKAELEAEILDLKSQLSHTKPDEKIDAYDNELEMDLPIDKVKYLEQRIEDLQKEIDRLHEPVVTKSFFILESTVHQNLAEFKALVDPATVDASIIGGQSLKEDRAGGKGDVVKIDENLSQKDRNGYLLAVRLWKSHISSNFGFEPSVAHEPLTIRGRKHGTDVYVDTKAMKIFIVYRTAQSDILN